jgi:hypothetical protein
MKRRPRLSLSVALLLLCGFGACTPQPARLSSRHVTPEHRRQWLSGAYRYDKNGWIFLHVEGKPFERGFQRGYLTAREIEDFHRTLSYLVSFQTAREPEYFEKVAARLFRNKVSAEYLEEMAGMVAGMRSAGSRITFDQMLYMNGFIDVGGYWWPQHRESMRSGCSAFIATGDATADGQIVMAHNSWIGYALGRFANIIIEIAPDKGHRILMQSWGPCIYSATDFFMTSAGLVGTETTIGGFEGFDREGLPVFERARRAMQYADDIDQWAGIMIENNNGAYANSWLIGDIRTGQIARLELGLKHHSLEKKTNGWFSGSNVTDDIQILRNETDSPYDDIRDRRVARRERWKQLMNEYHGRIDVRLARELLADHYDMYLRKEAPSCRTICGHYELDDGAVPRSPGAYRPGGAVDAKALDSEMAKSWQLWARWGSSCDIGFDADAFLREHTQYDWMEGYLKDLAVGAWTVFAPTDRK